MEFEEKVEKMSPTNGQLQKGANLIDNIKAKLEEQCPGIVSCANTIAFAVAESMTLGRSIRHLPFPNWSMDQMLNLFKKKGLNAEDMVTLNGAHSVGATHCNIFSERLYNYSNTGRHDPRIWTRSRKLVEKRNALLETDQAMVNEKRTTSFVRRMAEDLNLFSDGFFRSAYRKPRRG
ncbi:peroxidase 28-like [Senna tora]|uniref:peroxidase n=1 Tax=Senna tora TaxID=362788 RepID=A0A834SSX7_9FABA|nr:peroxidase 28-like [Senna tora]